MGPSLPPRLLYSNFAKWQRAFNNCSLLRYCELLRSFKFPELSMEEEEVVAGVAAEEVVALEEDIDAVVRISAGRIM